MTSVVYPSLDEMLTARRVHRRDDGSFAEDSYDYGVWWRDANGGVYRLTWIGGEMRDDPSLAGELYLVRLSGPIFKTIGELHMAQAGDADGRAELLCVVPPATAGRPDANADAVLEGWAEVCGSPDSVDWVRRRVDEAIAAGRAEPVQVPVA